MPRTERELAAQVARCGNLVVSVPFTRDSGKATPISPYLQEQISGHQAQRLKISHKISAAQIRSSTCVQGNTKSSFKIVHGRETSSKDAHEGTHVRRNSLEDTHGCANRERNSVRENTLPNIMWLWVALARITRIRRKHLRGQRLSHGNRKQATNSNQTQLPTSTDKRTSITNSPRSGAFPLPAFREALSFPRLTRLPSFRTISGAVIR